MPTQNQPTQNIEPVIAQPEGSETAVLVHKGYGTFGVSPAMLEGAVLAVRDGEQKARSSGKVQTFEISRKGHRQMLVIGRVYIVPPAVADDVKDFPTALLYGAMVARLNPNDIIDITTQQIGGSEFDEYSTADMKVIKDKLFKNEDGSYDVLVFFTPAWLTNREQTFFRFTKDEAKLKTSIRQLLFQAYFNPALSAAWTLLMERSDNLNISHIDPSVTFPHLIEGNKLEDGVNRSYPAMERVKQAGTKIPKVAFSVANLATIQEDVLEGGELEVLDEMKKDLEGHIKGEITPMPEVAKTNVASDTDATEALPWLHPTEETAPETEEIKKEAAYGMHDCPDCGTNVPDGHHSSRCAGCKRLHDEDIADTKTAAHGKKADKHEEKEINGHFYSVDIWEERDRLHISLTETCCDKEILDLWDDDARSAIEDGFIDPRDMLGSTIEYARELGLLGKDDPKEANDYEAEPVTSGINDMNKNEVPVTAASKETCSSCGGSGEGKGAGNCRMCGGSGFVQGKKAGLDISTSEDLNTELAENKCTHCDKKFPSAEALAEHIQEDADKQNKTLKTGGDIIPATADEALGYKTEEIGPAPIVGEEGSTRDAAKAKQTEPSTETKTEEKAEEWEKPWEKELNAALAPRTGGFSWNIPGQVLQEFYPDIQHEIVDSPNTANHPMIEDIDLVASVEAALDGKTGYMTGMVTADTRDTNISTSPAAGAGIGRDGKSQILEGAPLRQENDIRGYGFSEEYYKQYDQIPGAYLSLAAGLKKDLAGGKVAASKEEEVGELNEFLKHAMAEIAAAFVAAYKCTQRPPMNMVPGVGKVNLETMEMAGLAGVVSIGMASRVRKLVQQLNDGEMRDAINQASAQAAVWNGDKASGFVYEVFVRAEELDTDNCELTYSFITGTKGE